MACHHISKPLDPFLVANAELGTRETFVEQSSIVQTLFGSLSKGKGRDVESDGFVKSMSQIGVKSGV